MIWIFLAGILVGITLSGLYKHFVTDRIMDGGNGMENPDAAFLLDGDHTYVELPSVGDTFEKGQEFGTLESTKSVSPLFMPVAGTIKAVNEALVDAPEKVNQDPYGEGWLIEIESAEGVSELLDAAAYKAHLETL